MLPASVPTQATSATLGGLYCPRLAPGIASGLLEFRTDSKPINDACRLGSALLSKAATISRMALA